MRDYDIGDRPSDLQTTHTSCTAGRLYAGGLEEAAGHVEERRASFRAVSREWHTFWGFSGGIGPQKRPLGESRDWTTENRHIFNNRTWD